MAAVRIYHLHVQPPITLKEHYFYILYSSDLGLEEMGVNCKILNLQKTLRCKKKNI